MRDDLRSLIRDIPDFPQPGILFKDITPLMADADALADAVAGLAEYARPLQVDCVVAAEARGFLLGPALALELGAGFVLARKPGKLPYETVSAEYALEYGDEHARAAHATRSPPGDACSCTTTCSRPAAPRRRCASSSSSSAARSSAAAS